MILTLEIVSPRAPGAVESTRQTFRHEGGAIGRDPKSSAWVLSDPKVSGRHAVISWRESTFYIEDLSRNGTFLNSKRLTRGQPQALSRGDRLLIEPYEISVSIEGAREAAPSAPRGHRPFESQPFPDDDPFGSVVLGRSPLEPVAPPGDHPLDPLELLNLKAPPPVRRGPTADDLHAGDPLEFAYRPPDAVPEPAARPVAPPAPQPRRDVVIPANYNPLVDESQVIRTPGASPSASSVRMRVPPPEPAAPPAVPPVAPPVAFVPPPPPMAVVPPAAPAPPLAASPLPPPASSETGELRAFRSEESASFGRLPAPEASPVVPVAAPVASDGDVPAPMTAREGGRGADRLPIGDLPRVERAPHAAPMAAGVGASASSIDLAALLEGAGIDPSLATPELARQLGQILRVVVAGVMEVMQSRVDVKDEFGLKQTRFLPAENNPLKFSANVEDALHNLLVKRNPAYLGPVASFENAFADLAQHELAMLAGIRTAFDAMLAAWHPDRLQEEFDRQAGKGLVPGKLRYWDQFRERAHGLARDPDASFRRYFGEAFARAYEEQLRRVRAQGRRVDESDVSL